MGYYTSYSLKWKVLSGEVVKSPCEHEKPKDANFCPICGKPSKATIDSLIGEYIVNNSEKLYGINPDGDSVDTVKWYSHEEDIREMSAKFPDVLFTLHGEGEESGDVWKKYFLGGKMQIARAKITFDEFEQEKLA